MQSNIGKYRREPLESLSDIEAYLYNLPMQQKEYHIRLEHVRSVLASLGNPQNDIPAVHIAGTSGKGSTAYYASSILTSAGYRTGLMVSPHVHTVKERAQIDSAPLPDAAYIDYFNRFARQVASINLTYIEFLTVFAFWLFAQLRVDYIVIEVGVGGTLDPTNVIPRPHTIRAITDIGYDHMELLGSTLPDIASQKAGIIHSSDIVVTHEQPSEVMDVIKAIVNKQNATLHTATEEIDLDFSDLALYQRRNWTLACKAVSERLTADDQPQLDTQALNRSLAVTIPGRFEKRSYKGVELILDAAHNPQKMTTLAASLRHYSPHKKPIVVVAFGMNKKDSARESLEMLSSIALSFVVTEFRLKFGGSHTAAPASQLATMIDTRCFVEPSLLKSLSQATTLARERDTYVVVTGSFYLLDNIYPLLATDSQKTE